MVQAIPHTLLELIQNQLGVRAEIRDNPLTGMVALTDTIIAPLRPDRCFLSVSNLDAANTIYLRFNAPATGPLGIIVPAGASLVFKWSDDLILAQYELHAVATSAPVNVYVLEVLMI